MKSTWKPIKSNLTMNKTIYRLHSGLHLKIFYFEKKIDMWQRDRKQKDSTMANSSFKALVLNISCGWGASKIPHAPIRVEGNTYAYINEDKIISLRIWNILSGFFKWKLWGFKVYYFSCNLVVLVEINPQISFEQREACHGHYYWSTRK